MSTPPDADARDAEIARLRAVASRDHGHNEPCLMCGKPCNALAGNPSLWPLRLGNDGWHHTGCVNSALDRLRAPPGADVTKPEDLWRDLCEKDDRTSPEDYPDMALITEDELVSMLQQYGDERAAEARAAASSAASWAIHDIGLPATTEGSLELRIRLAQAVIAAIDVLAAKPGSET